MKPGIIFVTGTDTGVGKTVLTALLVRRLRERGFDALGVKPLCSGGRDDAIALHKASGEAIPLDELNPWHFKAPIAPTLAARREKKRITLLEVARYLRGTKQRSSVLLVEGAGGLLSPLGEGFDSRDLIIRLRATPLVVGLNQLGVVNQVRLTLEALPKAARERALVVLNDPARLDASSSSNRHLLTSYLDPKRLVILPRFSRLTVTSGRLTRRIRQQLDKITGQSEIA